MSDPAVEAAQRAWESEGWGSGNLQLSEGSLATAAAREALKPLRELHRPVSDVIGLEICVECSHRVTSTMWPCATARLIYTTQELEEGKS